MSQHDVAWHGNLKWTICLHICNYIYVDIQLIVYYNDIKRRVIVFSKMMCAACCNAHEYVRVIRMTNYELQNVAQWCTITLLNCVASRGE